MVVPAGAPETAPVTVVNASHAPVTGTAAEPRTVPVAEPARTWRVPPAPAEETRALNEVTFPSWYGWNAIQSPFSMLPTVLPPSAVPLSKVAMPDEVLKCSACRCRGWRVCWVCVVSPPRSVYSASKMAKMFAASSCSPSTGMAIEPEQPFAEVIWWPCWSWPST
ncbi:hypothetical protein C5N14_25405 [Micromonospora sp. MW-13]|nr:hypothetical protein C5N14_25405 [Micromonospora sp. MW-13]